MRFLRPLLAVYGTGIVGTFAWLFFALSGTSACAAGRDICQAVLGLTGQLALTWPAYWGGRIAGEPMMAPTLPVEVVLVSVLVFVAVLVFARLHALFVKPAPGSETAEPLIKTTEPNRRNQSSDPAPAQRS
ncbi:MAG: hypothetical protein V3U23_10140 [Kiloniellales bacterium]